MPSRAHPSAGSAPVDTRTGGHATRPFRCSSATRTRCPSSRRPSSASPGSCCFLGFVRRVGDRRLAGGSRRVSRGRRGPARRGGRGAVGAPRVDWTWEIPAVFGPAVVCAGLLAVLGAGSPARARRLLAGPGHGGRRLGRDGRGRPGRADEAGADAEQGRGRGETRSTGNRPRPSRRKPSSHGRPSPTRSWRCSRSSAATSTQALAYLRQAEARDSEDWRLPLIEARLQRERGDRGSGTRSHREGAQP